MKRLDAKNLPLLIEQANKEREARKRLRVYREIRFFLRMTYAALAEGRERIEYNFTSADSVGVCMLLKKRGLECSIGRRGELMLILNNEGSE